MYEYWIHHAPIRAGEAARFSVFEVDPEGKQAIVSPPGRLAASADVVNLLITRGVDPENAHRGAEEAIRHGLAKVVVRIDR
jgi:hypothetical protein